MNCTPMNNGGIGFPIINAILLLGTISAYAALVLEKITIGMVFVTIGPNGIEKACSWWKV